MKIAVFGATGRTGWHVVEQALAAGHRVVALARTPAKLDIRHNRLAVMEGDVNNPALVAQVVNEAGAVVSVLGPTSNRPVFEVSRGMQNILAAMRQHGVRRLVVSAGAGVRDANDEPKLFDRAVDVLLKLVARNAYADMQRMIDIVRASDRDWVIVRVPMLTDDPRTGIVKVGYVGKGMGARVTRADLAEFMLGQLESDTYLRRAPAISN